MRIQLGLCCRPDASSDILVDDRVPVRLNVNEWDSVGKERLTYFLRMTLGMLRLCHRVA